MSYTLLLDLDDTLLENNIEAFVPRYLQAFVAFLSGRVEAERFVAALFQGTRAMEQNRRPDCTLKEAFEAAFFPLLGYDPSTFASLAERFYAEEFPKLRPLTRPKAEAVQLVQEAQQRGYRLAVATNPLFPRTAILQRLEWANLPVDRYPFEVVACYEDFHYTKPDPAFFAEMLSYLGWPKEPPLIVGDDPQREVVPAVELGVAAFWVRDEGRSFPQELPLPTAQGSLSELLPWLQKRSPKEFHPTFDRPGALLAILRASPAALDGFFRRWAPEHYNQRPAEGEWCLTEVLCHLRDVEAEVNLPRLRKLVESENPFLEGKDTDRWAEERGYLAQDAKQALRQFIQARLELVSLLQGLDESGWERSARHAIFGPTTLRELVAIIAAHDRAHLQQVYQLSKTFPQV